MGSFARLLLCALTLLALPLPGRACTIAVVSGRVTPDGRPLLWKNRDTSCRANNVRSFEDGELKYVGVVNTGDDERVWMGMNEAGFCLLNSLALDLPRGHTVGRGNGRFIKFALGQCRTVDDFEELLKSTGETGRRTRANFGVIDATGAAVLFETGHRTYTKFDANDKTAAPSGYVVRSNFAMTSETTRAKKPEGYREIYSGLRYLRAESLLQEQIRERESINFRFFLQDCCRDLSLVPADAEDAADDQLDSVINTRRTINRSSTVSAAVFHGVRRGEDPRTSTMWTMLGEPVFSVAVPCWVTDRMGTQVRRQHPLSLLSEEVVKMRNRYYKEGSLLQAQRLPMIWRSTFAVERAILSETANRLSDWRKRPPQREEFAAWQREMAARALAAVRSVEVIERPAVAERR